MQSVNHLNRIGTNVIVNPLQFLLFQLSFGGSQSLFLIFLGGLFPVPPSIPPNAQEMHPTFSLRSLIEFEVVFHLTLFFTHPSDNH